MVAANYEFEKNSNTVGGSTQNLRSSGMADASGQSPAFLSSRTWARHSDPKNGMILSLTGSFGRDQRARPIFGDWLHSNQHIHMLPRSGRW
jgi:hypothetical protein